MDSYYSIDYWSEGQNRWIELRAWSFKGDDFKEAKANAFKDLAGWQDHYSRYGDHRVLKVHLHKVDLIATVKC